MKAQNNLYLARIPLAAKAMMIGFLCWILAINTAGPDLYTQELIMKNSPSISRFYDIFCGQVDNPFYRPNSPTDWHGGFLGFRILVPSIAHIFNLGCWGGVFFIWVAGAINLGLIYYYLASHLSGRLAAMFTAGLSMTVFSWGSHVYLGYPDAISHLFILLLIISKSPVICCLVTILSLINDERMILGIPLAIALINYDFRHDFLSSIKNALPFFFAVGIGCFAGYLLRLGIKTGAIGGNEILPPIYPESALGKYPIMYVLPGIFFSFHFLWILVWSGAFASLKSNNPSRTYWAIILSYAFLVILSSVYVWDYTRSLACLFPLFIIAYRETNTFYAKPLNKLMPILIILCFAIPKMDQQGALLLWNRPILISLYEYKTHKSVYSRIKELPYKSWAFDSR